MRLYLIVLFLFFIAYELSHIQTAITDIAQELHGIKVQLKNK